MVVGNFERFFAEHSWYFRNALIRANYREPLKTFPIPHYEGDTKQSIEIKHSGLLPASYLAVRNDGKTEFLEVPYSCHA